jgi:enhancing lycopene biosynthesis protein 2
MWFVYRIESVNNDLVAYACDPDGHNFPEWQTGELLAKITSVTNTTKRGRGIVHMLTTSEANQERASLLTGAQRCAATTSDIAQDLSNCTFAAVAFKSCGWNPDSTINTMIAV